MSERRSDRTDFTERRSIALRVEAILERIELLEGNEDTIGIVTYETPIQPPWGYEDLLAPEFNWTLRFEAEDIGMQPVHAICRVVLTGSSEKGFMETVTYGIDTRWYVRALGAEVEVADIWFHNERVGRDIDGNIVSRSESGVALPTETRDGRRIVLIPEQINDGGAYVDKEDIRLLSAILDQVEPSISDTRKRKAVGKTGLRLVSEE